MKYALLFLIGIFIITYFIDRKSINKGVCPECGEPLRYHGKSDGFFHTYSCIGNEPYHAYVAVISNPYLYWRYGRKMKNRR